ncbi:MAG: hypothetical protein ACI8PZ_006873 [Myxococcota bacterium]|jgi:hypothetical protein
MCGPQTWNAEVKIQPPTKGAYPYFAALLDDDQLLVSYWTYDSARR